MSGTWHIERFWYGTRHWSLLCKLIIIAFLLFFDLLRLFLSDLSMLTFVDGGDLFLLPYYCVFLKVFLFFSNFNSHYSSTISSVTPLTGFIVIPNESTFHTSTHFESVPFFAFRVVSRVQVSDFVFADLHCSVESPQTCEIQFNFNFISHL